MRPATLVAALALLALPTLVAAQQQSGARGSALSSGSQTFAGGVYRITQRNEAAVCSPRPLPPPAPSSPSDTEYVPAKAFAADSASFWVRETPNGSRLTAVVSMDSLGRDSIPPLTGTVQPDGGFSITRTTTLGPESGPRQGGHRFFVEHVLNVRGKHEQTPAGVKEAATGTGAYYFHSDSARGAVFTTCTAPFTASGMRVRP